MSVMFVVLLLLGSVFWQTPALTDTACNLDDQSALEYFQIGVEAYSEGEYEQAILSYTCALELDSTLSSAYVGRIGAYMGLGSYDEAFAEWQNYPDYPDLPEDLRLLIRATMLVEQGEFDEAKPFCLDALEVNPNNPNAAYLLGVIEAHLENFQSALTYLNQAIEISPDSADSFSYFFERAYVHYALEDRVLAEQDLEKALELQPDLIRLLFHRGDRYAQLGQEILVNDYIARLAFYYALQSDE